ncbi:hypothetical protein [Lentibacter sp. XHP0401]|jgi:phosphatidylethanolamine-binding protein (PEBP) family uncharacterized protein|uniref:hypothetical protein n=1 Tax=Lentibacter sp. XHP0401 TaxID=2984334 RepID=UPI0021E78FF4|nr:hypothetical protein [Lentibacter sp. XHP0401]MCV2892472.1 hypothetical protein [Lentibacter sp. XHP0401]
MKPITLAAALILAAGTAHAEMQLSFKGWGNIPSCTTGKPNTVGNPAFTLKGIPAGTTQVQIRLKDLDVPGYNHGGGKLKMTADGTIPAGTFKYKSPCPPSGVHTYEWTATAKKGNKTLATAKAARKYP